MDRRLGIIAMLLLVIVLIGCGQQATVTYRPAQAPQKTQPAVQPAPQAEPPTVPQQAPTESTAQANTPPQPAETIGSETTASQPTMAADGYKEFKVESYQFGWDPDTIEVNKGDKVRLILSTRDVAHGFAIRDYKINQPIKPGKTSTVEFVADQQGIFTWYCSVFCGAGHGAMKGKLIVK